MWCATTSCSSRAIRSRSSVTRRCASSSRVCSATRARSSAAASTARFPLTAKPIAQAMALTAASVYVASLSHGIDDTVT